jgi:hypothetical protein
MKNITSMLNSGNLTPREKFILLIQNDIHKTKTGKDILTPADKDALENWRAKDNNEANEWNRLNDGWKHLGRMEIEVEFIYKDARIAYLANLPILMELLYYPANQRMGKSISALERIKTVELSEAVRIASKQRDIKMKDGLDFDYAVYQLAFERLDEGDKKRLNNLYTDIETDHQYLDQEEIIANLYNGKKELTHKAKEKLGALVAEQSYNKFAKEFQLFHYFACIPLIEVARYFLKSKGVEVKGKAMAKNQEADDYDTGTSETVTLAMKAYAAKHSITIQNMLKEGCVKWLDDGLLDDYTPLVISDDSELLKRWLLAKAGSRVLLRKHIDAGELKIRTRTDRESLKDKLYSKNLYDSEFAAAQEILEHIGVEITEKGELDEKRAFEKFEDTVITGESIYAFKENYSFVKKFKERVDTYDANLGIVYADDDPEQNGDHLDRELLICNLNDSGKPNFFSLYNMSVVMLSGLFESKSYFKETTKNGKTFIEFKDSDLEIVFRQRRDMLIEGYAKLVAFEGVFEKMSKIYETDLTDHVTERIKALRIDIEQYNGSIRVATNTNTDQSKNIRNSLYRNNKILQFKDDLIIDTDGIKPDGKAMEEHEAKLKAIFKDL